MSGGRPSRQKGNRTERVIMRLLQEYGFAVVREALK
jgi:Holliday junction resolvase